jgi:hypothetical protein
LALGERFDGLERKVDDGVKALVDILDLMRADLRDVKIALGPFVRTVASLEDSVRGLDRRVVRLEEKKSERIGLAIEDAARWHEAMCAR